MSTLFHACKNDDLKRVQELSNNDNVNKMNENGYYPLELAILASSFECSKYLFDTFNLNPFKLNDNDTNAIAYTVMNNQVDIFNYFIQNSERYSCKTKKQLLCETPCSKFHSSLIDLVVINNHIYSVNFLKQFFIYIQLDKQLCKRIFFNALKILNLKILQFIIDEKHYNSTKDLSDVVNWHLNISLNYSDDMRYENANTTPLIHAIHSCSSGKFNELCDMLLSVSVIDVNLANKPVCSYTPLSAAVSLNQKDVIVKLLKLGVNKTLNPQDNDLLPLHMAITLRTCYSSNCESSEAKTNFEIIKLLATNNDDAHLSNKTGLCAFDYAVSQKLQDVCEYFKSLGADLYKRRNNTGNPPIFYCYDENDEFGKFVKKLFK